MSGEELNPLTRVSPHFVVADFLGNTSVYTKGYANPFLYGEGALKKIDNMLALANHGLEPILAKWGPLSISYGYISPELSRRIVTYMDPNQPSHHRFDLGAAVDICVHRWVAGEREFLEDLYLPLSVRGAPIALAHGIDMEGIPYSRLITYSESPYICLAISHEEVQQGQIRKAFYENRYQGQPKAKPEYIKLSTINARRKHFQQLQEQGLEHPWEGGGYPSYHGGGFRQYQHRRVSKYTMVSDWLFDLQSIANGAKNIPSLDSDQVQDAFAAAGTVYDAIVDGLEINRMSIVGGYVSPLNPYFDPDNDWRENIIGIEVIPPEHLPPSEFVKRVNTFAPLLGLEDGPEVVRIWVDVNEVLTDDRWLLLP